MHIFFRRHHWSDRSRSLALAHDAEGITIELDERIQGTTTKRTTRVTLTEDDWTDATVELLAHLDPQLWSQTDTWRDSLQRRWDRARFLFDVARRAYVRMTEQDG